MHKRKTFVDSCVLISAWRGSGGSEAGFQVAMEAITDPDREYVISDFLRLELLVQPTYHQNDDEVEFMNTFFNAATEEVKSSARLVERAFSLACSYGLKPFDALLATAAIESKVEEFITFEKRSKPFNKITELNVTSLH
ncbi:MAG: type II toxin-antitoxin system VapC family toxin [Nitrospinae bacterium]|nr:type II toxin-antitoxin system VapC family toxin [Nitrospinota bacterium]